MEWVSIAEKLWKDVKYNDPRYRAGMVSLPFKKRLSFSLGHVFSDLCWIIWSVYLLLYFTKVVGLPPSSVGYLFVIAQCSDALLTPFIEVAVDRIFPKCFPSYGRRKLWHLFGTVLVILTWPLIFSSCLVCNDDNSPSARLGYYSVVVVVLHVGWSILRVSHFSLLPDVVQRPNEVAELNAIRAWMSFVCGMFVFSIHWILLGQVEGVNITPGLQKHFTTLSLIIVGFGLLFSFLFQWGTVEPEASKCQAQSNTPRDTRFVNHRKASFRDLYVMRRHTESSIQTDDVSHQADYGSSVQDEGVSDQIEETPARSWRQWFSDSDLHKVAVVYVCSRVVTTVLQLYSLFYVTDTLGFTKEAIAYFPLVLLVTEVVANTLVTKVHKVLGNKWTFCAASAVVFQSCVWFQLQSQSSRNFVFVSVILFGASSSIMMATSLSMLIDVVKKDKGSSGFIYSTMGFFDKILVGIVVLIIQKNYPVSLNGNSCTSCGSYARLVVTMIPSVFTAVALLVVFFTFKTSVFVSCKNAAYREEQWTQTDLDGPPPTTAQTIESVYTVNEENNVTTTRDNDNNTDHSDKYDDTDSTLQGKDSRCLTASHENDDNPDPSDKNDDTNSTLQGKGTRCLSAPVLSMRRSFSFPVTSSKSPVHRSSIPECQTLEGVALAVEKVVVFSFDSLVAGELLSMSEKTPSLPHSTSLDEAEKEEPDQKSSKNVYQQISLLRSTEL